MINALHDDRENIDLLKSIQRQLVGQIVLTERKIRAYKQQATDLKLRLRREHLPKAQARAVKRKAKLSEGRTRKFQWLLYLWRAFGDAAAFIYLDKWNVKPLLYSAESPSVKQGSGFLDGKIGFAHEWSILMAILDHGVPAVLTDLTNSIRHGDICIMRDGFPRLIEVKTNKNESARTLRQTGSLLNIQRYLLTDEGENVRGMQCKRIGFQTREVNYLGLLNELLGEAVRSGNAIGHPERGLVYLVTRNRIPPLDVIKEMSEPALCFLNEEKTNSTWMSYYPFTLAIRNPEHLYAFVRGDLTIIIVLDCAVLRTMAADRKLVFSVLGDSEWGWHFERRTAGNDEPTHFRISRHFIIRIGLECLSPRWVFENMVGIALDATKSGVDGG